MWTVHKIHPSTSACMMCNYFSSCAINRTPTIGCIKYVTDLSRVRWTQPVLFSAGRCLCKGSAFCKVCHGDPFGEFPCGEGLITLWQSWLPWFPCLSASNLLCSSPGAGAHHCGTHGSADPHGSMDAGHRHCHHHFLAEQQSSCALTCLDRDAKGGAS